MSQQHENIGWTTLLGDMMRRSPSTPKENMMKYEAFLCQCAYLCRLAYTPAEIFCRMMNHLEVSPDIFNDYITLLEGFFYQNFPYDRVYDSMWLQKQPKYKDLFSSSSTILNKKNQNIEGIFYKSDLKLNTYIYFRNQPNSRINPKSTLFVIFKGSSSIDDFIHDVQFIPIGLENFPYLQKIQDADKCLIHKGFISLLENEIVKLILILTDFVKQKSPKQIVITGHSLGGALATIFAFALVKGIETREIQGINDIPIHLITFGAPTIFADRTRIEFNKLLTSGKLTLDRVNSKTVKTPIFDVIPTIPPGISHPGFNILNDELFPYKRTKRTEQIGELRDKVMGKQPGITYDNDLYAYNDFLDLFQTRPKTPAEFRENLRHLGGTTKIRRKNSFQKALPDAKHIDMSAIEGIGQAQQPISTSDLKINVGGIGLGGKWSSKYKAETIHQMPNQIIYNCYKTLSGVFCHGGYMGVGFLSCLRVPSFKSGPKKEPCSDYYLIQNDGRLYATPIPGTTSKSRRCQNQLKANANLKEKIITTFVLKNNKKIN